MWELIEKFRRGIIGAGREWSLFDACSIMGVNLAWFVDERSLELVEMYLFACPNPSQAIQKPFNEQPNIWIQSKIIIDSVFPSLV